MKEFLLQQPAGFCARNRRIERNRKTENRKKVEKRKSRKKKKQKIKEQKIKEEKSKKEGLKRMKKGITIRGIDHITINVTDMQESMDFYENVIGLQKLEMIDMGDHIIQYFKMTESTRLELIWYERKIPAQPKESEEQGLYRHMAICVENIKELEKELLGKNVKITMKSSECPKLKCVNMLIEDPSGVEIEFLEKVGN